MSLIRATDATITITNPRMGVETTFPRGIVLGMALSISPWGQAEAAAAARAEKEAYRERVRPKDLSGSFTGPLTYFNSRLFEVLGGSHTRRAMRYRKICRYIRAARKGSK